MPRADAIKADRRALRLAAFLAPTITGLQPLIGGVVSTGIVVVRIVGLPLLAAALRPRSIHWPTLLGLLLLTLVTGAQALVAHPYDYLMVSGSLFGSIVLFRFGVAVGQRTDLAPVWAALVHGLTVFNLITMATLILASAGIIDAQSLLERLQKDVAFGLPRFSIGNPIEVPFVVSALLYAGIRHGRQGSAYLGPAFINLVVAAISESRVVILIAALILVECWWKTRIALRAWSLLAMVLICAVLWEHLSPIATSIVNRFGGDDFGSTADREFLLRTVIDSLEPISLLFGNGLTGGAQLLLQKTGDFRTVESVVLQLIVELGLIGILLLVAAGTVELPRRAAVFPGRSLTRWALWIQPLFFLPIFNLMPMVAFALGALANPLACADQVRRRHA